VVAYLLQKITHAAQAVILINGPFNRTHPFPSEDESSQLTKLPAYLRLLIGALVIAAGTLTLAAGLAPVFQQECHTGWLELWSHSCEWSFLHDMDSVAESGDNGIVDHRLGE
jgi:multisubunit Na+/H+ antiporter MnhC subunit